MRTEDVLAQIDDALDDWEVGPDAVRFNASPATRTAPVPVRVSHVPRSMLVAIVADTSAFVDAMRSIQAVFERSGGFLTELLRRFGYVSPYDEHHPRPLAIDGASYHRRMRARGRR